MRKTKKQITKIISVMLVATIVIASAPLSGLIGLELPDLFNFSIKSNAATYSGTCGTNLTWTFDDLTGTLTISGSGDMNDFTSSSSVPWYSNRSYVKSVTINEGVTSIGEYAFYGCDSLTSITIPNDVTSIGDSAFENCESLKSITIPDSVTNIGEWAFGDCTSLTSIAISNSVTKISESTFESCVSLKTVNIPNSVISIDDYAFCGCISLETVNIPNSVTSISSYVFAACPSLENIVVDEDNKYYSSDEYGVLFNKDKTILIQYPIGNKRTNYTVPDNVICISDLSFAYCPCIAEVMLEYLTDICKNNITSIVIPDSVVNIGLAAFYKCDNEICDDTNCNRLTDVYYTGTVEEWNAITIDSYNDCLTDATIHYNYTPEHTETFSYYATEHPHYAIYMCSCGYENVKSETSIVDTCEICNPPHICDYSIFVKYQDAHPHYAVYMCSCGYEQTSTETTTIDTCYFCHPELFTLGDVNGDGAISPIDARMILQAIAGITYWSSEQSKFADANKDGVISAVDARMILQAFTGLVQLNENGDNIEPDNSNAMDSDISISLETDKTSVSVGDTFTVTGRLSSNHNLGALGFDILYNPELVKVVTVSSSFGCVINSNYSSNKVRLASAVVSSTTTDDLFTIEFEVIKDGNVEIGADVIEAYVNKSNYGSENVSISESNVSIKAQSSTHEHTMSVWYVTEEPTCNESGTKARNCVICDYIETEELPATGTCSYAWVVTKNATCTENGEKALMCTTCKEVKTSVIIYLLGHTWSEWIVTTEATTTTEGLEERECSECGKTESAIIPKLEDTHSVSIQTPSYTEIKYKDSIILHANIDGSISEDSKVIWSTNNDNFTTKNLGDNSFQITSNKKGYTTITATLFDADGNILATDSIEMYSSAGFGQKIAGFFRSLFGLTKIYDK